MLEEDREEVEVGFHSFEGSVAVEEVETVHFDLEVMIEGEEVPLEGIVKYVMMKQHLMEAVEEEERC